MMQVLLMIGFLSAAGANLMRSNSAGFKPPKPRSFPRPPYSPLLDDLVSSHENMGFTPVDYGGNHPFERRRNLEEIQEDVGYSSRDTYSNLRLQFITDPIEGIRSSINGNKIDLVLNTVLPAVASVWGGYLSVFPVTGSVPVSNQDCFGVYAQYISSSLTEVGNADLAIMVGAEDVISSTAGDITVCTPGVLAIGLTCAIDQFDRPVIGAINFCLGNIDNSVRRLEEEDTHDNRKLLDSAVGGIIGRNDPIADTTLVAIHEVGHVLGFSLSMFKYFRDAETGEPLTPRPFSPTLVTCDDGTVQRTIFPSTSTIREGQGYDGRTFHEIVTPRVTQVVRNEFNCQNLTGARLENRPTSPANNCTGSHWDERIFLSELMGPVFSGYTDALSPLTLALMEDSGFYKVSYENAELSPFGHGFGCDFVNQPCIVNDAVPDYARGAFCSIPTTFSSTGQLDSVVVMCEPTHKSFAICDLFDITTIPADSGLSVPSDAIRYFSDPNLVSLDAQTDFCPLALLDAMLDCTNSDQNTDIQSYQGESRGPNSRCINAEYGTTVRPGCFDITCDAEQHKLIIAGQTCEYEGQSLSIRTADGSQQGTMICPRLGTICPQLFCRGECSGRGVCDYEAVPPRCNCFDTTDTSEACSKGLPPATPTQAPTTRPPTNGSSGSSGSSGATIAGGTFALGTILISAFLEIV